MSNLRLPGVYYKEELTYELDGDGSKIPVFIGVTNNKATYNFISYASETVEEELGHGVAQVTGETNGDYSEIEVLTNVDNKEFIGQKYYVLTNASTDNKTRYPLKVKNNDALTDTGMYVTISDAHKVDGTQWIRYDGYKYVNLPIEEGGLGKENSKGEVPTGNDLMQTIQEFYEESRLRTSTDVGVPYIYVIDIGDGSDYNCWLNALKTSKSLLDVQMEIYVGAYVKTFGVVRTPVICKVPDSDGETEEDYKTVTELLTSIYAGINGDGEYGLLDSAENLDLRYAFTTVKDATDDDLIGITSKFTESRVGLCEPLLFGKTIARICCTPNNTEPGYYKYRSVSEDTFIKRSKKQMKILQDAGIIFNSDEHINGVVHPKINLCVATSFADNPRPADSLFHARFNADGLLREIFEASYDYVKANETSTNIAYLQTRINKLVNDRVIAEEMVKWDDATETGTRLRVSQNPDDPYSLLVKGHIQPVKTTIAIDVNATLRI